MKSAVEILGLGDSQRIALQALRREDRGPYLTILKDEARRRYRRLASRLHPDRFADVPGGEQWVAPLLEDLNASIAKILALTPLDFEPSKRVASAVKIGRSEIRGGKLWIEVDVGGILDHGGG